MRSTSYNEYGYQWHVEVVPAGTSRSHAGQVAIFLAKGNVWNATPPFKLAFSVTVLNLVDASRNLEKVAHASCVFPGELGIDNRHIARVGWDNFMSWTDLNEEGFLRNGDLNIQVVMRPPQTALGSLKHVGDRPPLRVSSMVEDMQKLRESTTMCDVKLVSDGREFPAHRVVLAACSEVFRNMFTTEMVEKSSDTVNMSDIGIEAVELLLEYVYTREIDKFPQASSREKLANPDVDSKIIGELFRAARKYELAGLAGMCEAQAIAAITLESVVDWLMLAAMLGADLLKNECMRFIIGRVAEVQATPGWARLLQDKQLSCELMPLILAEACPPLKRVRHE